MALKIFTEARPFLKAYLKPFGITEIRMLTSNSGKLQLGAQSDNIILWYYYIVLEKNCAFRREKT